MRSRGRFGWSIVADMQERWKIHVRRRLWSGRPYRTNDDASVALLTPNGRDPAITWRAIRSTDAKPRCEWR
jgi:hypothetical protein